MVSAWIYDPNTDSDPRLPNQCSPNRPVSIDELKALGVLYWFINVDEVDWMDKIDSICRERNYKNRDEITVSKDKLPNYDEKLKMFFTEHLHEDEEIRFIKDGSGFFDVRSADDVWIRIHTVKNDLIILPAGIYHRFIVDSNDYINALRLFKEEPKWTPINRSQESDHNIFRTQYINLIKSNN